MASSKPAPWTARPTSSGSPASTSTPVAQKGRVRDDANALRFVEVTVNGPKTWSLAAALHPEISAALDEAQDKAATEIVGWVAQHATTRVGPRGRQVQVPVEKIEAAVIRHYTSRAGDPHRHLHLQINARVWAAGAWRGIHSVGIRDSIEAINGIGHAAVATDPQFRSVLAAHGLTLDPETSEIRELAPYVGAFSARTAQIRRNVDRYEAAWRAEHPGEEPGPRLREAWDRRAWAEARPDKVVPTDGRELVARWNDELRELGYRDPTEPVPLDGDAAGVDRPRCRSRAGRLHPRGEEVGLEHRRHPREDRGPPRPDLPPRRPSRAGRARRRHHRPSSRRGASSCSHRTDVPEHVRSLSSPQVLQVEDDIITRIARRAAQPARKARIGGRGLVRIDPTQAAVVGALAGDGPLVVVEGAAGAGKTTALRSARELLSQQRSSADGGDADVEGRRGRRR
ncbi:MAG: MobF family relaxase [Nocardioidaceae bacterium]